MNEMSGERMKETRNKAGEVKIKLTVNEAPCCEDVGGNGCTAPCIVNQPALDRNKRKVQCPTTVP
jgi:hypothetical protein